jgi:hypothetical protein
MRKTSFLFAVLLTIFAANIFGADLYKVMVHSPFDADRLNSAGAEPIAQVQGGYLVLLNPEAVGGLLDSEIELKLIATDISRNQLALDLRLDRANVERYPLIFEEDQVRLYLIDEDQWQQKAAQSSIMPIKSDFAPIRYIETQDLDLSMMGEMMDLQTLIDMVSQDSLESYATVLETYGYRLAGSLPNYTARDWFESKFVDIGYDSIYIDSFTTPDQCANLVVTKLGTVLPDHHVVVGAHYDAVSGSPGADDNGSGSDGVLEIARILKDIETELTFVFILFDSEEQGLLGAHHYADEAFLRGDSIVYMLNMDMIAHFQNSTQANLYHGADVAYTYLWMELADSLVGITGVDAGAASNSDHAAFTQYGWPATFVHEYIFSTVYHSNQDSTTYMNFEYMTLMVKASLATVYSVSETYIPGPSLIFGYPDGIPSFAISGADKSFEVNITGFYGGILVPGTAQLHYALDGGGYTATPLAEITSSRFSATLPAAPCGSHYTFYISAEEDSMGMFYSPDPSEPNDMLAAESETMVFYDNFETDLGWSVSGNASDGQWDRGVPVGGGDRGDPPTDYDGSGSCYLTDNVDDNSDVDGGTTYLDSPIFDLASREGKIHYARWYSNSFGGSPYADEMKVYISNNGGGDWILAETVGPFDQASGGWFEYSFWVSQFVTPTDQMRVRFEVSDLGSGSVVEAGVDDFMVTSYICGSGEPPEITTASMPDGMMGVEYSEQLDATGGFGPKTWSDEMGNLGGTGLTISASGLVSGMPLSMGPVIFTATVTDAIGGIDEQFYMFQVGETYICGDANSDDDANVADAVYIINFVFKGGPAPIPPQAGDANCDGENNIADGVYLINFVFKGGPAPCCP